MDSFFKRPDELQLEGNLEDNWNRFYRQFVNFLKIVKSNKTEEMDGPTKVAMLLNFIGDEANELFETFKLTDVEKNNYDKVVAAYIEYCKPKSNVLFERFKFYQRIQLEGESFDHFYADVKKLTKSCSFGTELENMERDRLVLGIRHLDLQEALIRQADNSLQAIVDKCRKFEINVVRARVMQKEGSEVDVDAVKRFQPRQQTHRPKPYDRNTNERNETGANQQCKWCGYKHKKGSCRVRHMERSARSATNSIILLKCAEIRKQ